MIAIDVKILINIGEIIFISLRTSINNLHEIDISFRGSKQEELKC